MGPQFDLIAKATDLLVDRKQNTTSRQRKNICLVRSKITEPTQTKKPAGEKYIVKLSTLTMRQLIRRLHQAARIAAHCRHEIVKLGLRFPESSAPLQLKAVQDNALECFRHIDTEIKFRTKSQ